MVDARLAGLLLATFALLVALPSVTAQEPTGTCVTGLTLQVDQNVPSVTLTWNAIPGAASYDIHRSVDGGPFLHHATTTEATFFESGVPGGVLEYTVAADGHPTPETCERVSVHIHGEEPPPPLPTTCVEDVRAIAQADGSVRLEWGALAGAVSFEVLRAEGAGALAPFAVVNGDTTVFLDATTVPGVTYRYVVTANGLPTPDMDCPVATVTAIPFFPAAWVAWGATFAALGGYLRLRR
jgi:hypothetical protein